MSPPAGILRDEEDRPPVPRKPVPTSVPGGNETVNGWLLEWNRDRTALEEAERANARLTEQVAKLRHGETTRKVVRAAWMPSQVLEETNHLERAVQTLCEEHGDLAPIMDEVVNLVVKLGDLNVSVGRVELDRLIKYFDWRLIGNLGRVRDAAIEIAALAIALALRVKP